VADHLLACAGEAERWRSEVAGRLIDNGARFRLKELTRRVTGSSSPGAGGRVARKGRRDFSALQEKLYADNRWALLLIFQAMDAAGKDGAISTPRFRKGCRSTPLSPSAEESDFVADDALFPRARANRHLQPLLL
jgi:hypothetical protein